MLYENNHLSVAFAIIFVLSIFAIYVAIYFKKPIICTIFAALVSTGVIYFDSVNQTFQYQSTQLEFARLENIINLNKAGIKGLIERSASNSDISDQVDSIQGQLDFMNLANDYDNEITELKKIVSSSSQNNSMILLLGLIISLFYSTIATSFVQWRIRLKN